MFLKKYSIPLLAASLFLFSCDGNEADPIDEEEIEPEIPEENGEDETGEEGSDPAENDEPDEVAAVINEMIQSIENAESLRAAFDETTHLGTEETIDYSSSLEVQFEPLEMSRSRSGDLESGFPEELFILHSGEEHLTYDEINGWRVSQISTEEYQELVDTNLTAYYEPAWEAMLHYPEFVEISQEENSIVLTMSLEDEQVYEIAEDRDTASYLTAAFQPYENLTVSHELRIDADTNLPELFELTASGITSYGDEEVEVDYQAVIDYEEWNGPIEIEVPEEAGDAVEITE